ncbi:hypothetical protein FTX61_19605 [Nitriliruptoraceae bacterium ZYF776]|nr:hypothetical protein [Profundirhabdus halotolerans]
MERAHRSRGLGIVMVLAALITACSGGGEEAGESPSDLPSDALQVTGTDQLAFTPAQLTAGPGEITVELTSESGVAHDFVIEEGDVVVAEAAAGQTSVGTVELDTGTYTFYCAVPGHRSAGMEGTLEVTG